jgi:hypothetical protein
VYIRQSAPSAATATRGWKPPHTQDAVPSLSPCTLCCELAAHYTGRSRQSSDPSLATATRFGAQPTSACSEYRRNWVQSDSMTQGFVSRQCCTKTLSASPWMRRCIWLPFLPSRPSTNAPFSLGPVKPKVAAVMKPFSSPTTIRWIKERPVEIIQGQPRGFGTNLAFDDFNASGPRGGGRSCGISGALAVLVIRQIDRTEPWTERRRVI